MTRCCQVDDPDVVNFLLQTEIIPLCLRIMETGSELSKTVATFIVQKILLDEAGLSHICATPERFYAVSGIDRSRRTSSLYLAISKCVSSEQVSNVLAGMVTKLLENPSVRLLKHIVRCYLRLSEHTRWVHLQHFHCILCLNRATAKFPMFWTAGHVRRCGCVCLKRFETNLSPPCCVLRRRCSDGLLC